MVTRIEPRVPLVNDEDEELADANRYDAASICTMDVVDEHRYRPPDAFTDPLPAAPPARARSPSIYSMFTTDHTHSSRPRCKNPSVYSMPISAFRTRGGQDDFGDRGIEDEQSGSSEDDGTYDDEEDFDGDDGDRVFMTRRSRNAVADRNTDTHSHSHMNFRSRCKNPSVYSMPIMGASKREVDSVGHMRTLRVAPLVPLPFAEEGSHDYDDKDGYYDSDGDTAEVEGGQPGTAGYEAGYADDGNQRPRSHLKRVTSRRVQPTMKDNIANGFTSCRGRPNDDTLPPSYHITVCVGIVGVLFFFGGLTMTIVGFNSQSKNPDGTDDSQKALRVLGPIVLCLGFFMCLGCFLYLCVVYTRYKRLSSYLKNRNSARQMRRAAAQQGVTENGYATDPNRVEPIQHSTEAAAEDIRQMLQTLQTGGEIGPRDTGNALDDVSASGDTPL